MSNNSNRCIANSCYGVYRTSFDRMMQNKHSPFCKPSSQLVCDQTGNPVLKNTQQQGVLAEKYRARREHAMRARKHQASVERFIPAEGPDAKGKGKGNGNGNGKGKGKGGKKKAVVLTKEWCGYCTKIKEEMADIMRMLNKMGIEVEVAPDHKVDPLMKEHKDKGASGFPATLLMDDDEVMDVVSGYMPAEKFARAVAGKYGL